MSMDRTPTTRLHEYRFIKFFRAAAAAWVVVGHCLIWGGWHGLPYRNTKSAVDLFMMISGCLMVANANRRALSEPLGSFRGCLSFYLRRYFRIAPVYYLALAISMIFVAQSIEGTLSLQSLDPAVWPAGGKYDPSHFRYSLEGVILHVTFLFGLFPKWSLSSMLPDWSLSLEMQFYAAFPFIYTFVRKARLPVARYWFVGTLSVGAGYLAEHYANFPEPSLLFLKLHFFLAGMLLAEYLESGRPGALAAAFALTLLDAIVRWNFTLMHVIHAAIAPSILGCMVLLGQLEAQQRTPKFLARIIGSRVVNFASDVSYGVYLFHGFFICLCGYLIARSQWLHDLGSFSRFMFILTITLVGAYLCGAIVHRTVELPFIRIGKRVMGNLIRRQ